jgi:hypothetical protein
MKHWYKYLTKKERREFWLLSGVHLTFLLGGIVMMCFGMETGAYGFILLITYIPYYHSVQDMAEIRIKANEDKRTD